MKKRYTKKTLFNISMNTFFAPHGEFKINVSNNILIARLVGSWNQECAESFSQAFKTHIQSLKDEKWGHLVFLDDWELSVPEILPIVTDLVSFCIENGLEKSAQVYSESMMKIFLSIKWLLKSMATLSDKYSAIKIKLLNGLIVMALL